MATTLQQQLAAINAKSTDQLNLKAQKVRHSQSLLFEPREAASQSFDSLFQICLEGFAELCQLDRRYTSFAQNLFAESSVSVEREQMTATENKELDAVVQQFLGLISGKLLLRPAQKSVEWLVRRWRIHEYNTSTMLYGFLPYHGHEIFATVLSILPKQIPHEFSFLRPYIASLQCPPRHALVSAAVNNPSFITNFSSFVLSASRRRLQSSLLVGSWASILAQSLNAKLDSAQSGRDEVRRQKSEDVLLGILPTLEDMLAISDAPDLFLAACMIMTILATKVELEDKVLDAMMESIARSWTRDTVKDGIECIAVLAEEKHTSTIPRTVFGAIVSSDDAASGILSLKNRLRADNLIAGLLECYLSSPRNKSRQQGSELVTELLQHALDTGLMSNAFRQKVVALKQRQTNGLWAELKSLLNQVVDGNVKSEAEDVQMLDADPPLQLDNDLAPKNDDIEVVLQSLPVLPHADFSFFAIDTDTIFSKYLACYEKCYKSEVHQKSFFATPALHAQHNGQRLELFTFLTRCWTSATQPSVKRSALQAATKLLASDENLRSVDLQVIYPYILTALSDASAQVRKAAAQLLSRVLDCSVDSDAAPWAESTMYGSSSRSLLRLKCSTAKAFLSQAIEPRLEECVLDEKILTSGIAAFLNDNKVKSATRSAIISYIASHVTLSIDQNMQLSMLSILQNVGKAATDARTAILAPYIKQEARRASPVLQAMIQSLTHRSNDEIETLRSIAVDAGSIAYSRVSEIFCRCKADVQDSLAIWLFARATPEEHDEQNTDAAAALQALRSIQLSVPSLVHLLSLLTNKSSSDLNRSAKRQRLSKTSNQRTSLSLKDLSLSLKRASLCLEVVEDSLADRQQRVDDQHHTQLIKQLFGLLGEIQSWRTATESDLTYLQVLTLNNILATLEISNAKIIDHSYLRTDMIVETLRSTASPQVHNSALLVISKIATFAPDAVLHSVMPLFTFMSSSTLRQADAYSVHVINMTIESIVPPLRESLKSRGKDLVAGASDLLLSFTAAFEHIPGHRRHDTFVQVLKVLGPNDALYAVMAMLVERYSEDNTLVDTLRGIASSFNIRTQMHALAQYLDLVTDACKKRRGLSDTILGFSEKNAAEANSSVASLLGGWTSLVSSPVLRSKLNSELRKDNAQLMLDIYGTLLERLVSLPRLEGNVVKFAEPTLKNAHDSALQALLALLPTEEFITSSAGLMQAGSEQVRVQVFDSLTQRVRKAKTNDARLVQIFIETLPNCSVFLSTSQPVSVRKAALACVDAICEKFGKRDRNAVGDVVKVVLGPSALLSESPVLQAASLLCLASSVEILGEEFVSVAGQALGVALDLTTSILDTGDIDQQLVDASFSLLNAVLDHQAWLLDETVLDRALTIACKVYETNIVDSWSAKQFCTLAPKQVTLRDLCTALNRTFYNITALGSTAMLARAEMLHLAIASNAKAAITQNAELLSTLVLQLFGVRQHLTADDDSDSGKQAYETSIQTALDMTLKMNDLTFRPLYMRLVAWAETAEPVSTSQPDQVQKQIALYDFSQRLFDQLGTIVTTYASFILDNASASLIGSRSNSHWPELAISILKTLRASFKQDQDDFWTAPQHFEPVAKPLLGLLVQPFTTGNAIISDTIVELAANVSGSSEHLKSMNTQIMAALRNSSPANRLAAVKCERDITERLTFDWLNLLPEMLPFISELLEDDDEAVEREVLGWVAQIEEITGESLEGMLA